MIWFTLYYILLSMICWRSMIHVWYFSLWCCAQLMFHKVHHILYFYCMHEILKVLADLMKLLCNDYFGQSGIRSYTIYWTLVLLSWLEFFNIIILTSISSHTLDHESISVSGENKKNLQVPSVDICGIYAVLYHPLW